MPGRWTPVAEKLVRHYNLGPDSEFLTSVVEKVFCYLKLHKFCMVALFTEWMFRNTQSITLKKKLEITSYTHLPQSYL